MAKKPKGGAANSDDDESAEDLPNWLISGTAIKPSKHEWDWQGRIQRYSVNLIDGRKGLGKSSVMAALAAAICHGRKLPGETKGGPKGRVMWCGSEEESDKATLPRWLANGGRKDTFETLDFRKMTESNCIALPYDWKRFAAILEAKRCRVLVMDPFDCLTHEADDMNHPKKARGYMESFLRLASVARVTVLMARHLKKAKSKFALDEGLSSVAIPNTARVCLRVDEHPCGDGSRLLSVVVGNYTGEVQSIIYKLEKSAGGVYVAKFGKESSLPLDEIMDGSGSEDDSDERLDGQKVLLSILKNGPMLATEIAKEGARALVSIATLRRVKKKLRIPSKRSSKGSGGDGEWRWFIPDGFKYPK